MLVIHVHHRLSYHQYRKWAPNLFALLFIELSVAGIVPVAIHREHDTGTNGTFNCCARLLPSMRWLVLIFFQFFERSTDNIVHLHFATNVKRRTAIKIRTK